MKLILGSASPRRKEILSEFFENMIIIHPRADESVLHGETPEAYVKRITNEKMKSILTKTSGHKNFIAVTSDTIVTIDGLILGKPASYAHAFEMLSLLSGREHHVITGLTIHGQGKAGIKSLSGMEKTSVVFKRLDSSEINNYLGMVNYSDKAGSYAIQEHGHILISSVNGSISNVIGFPLRLFFALMSRGQLTSVLFSLRP